MKPSPETALDSYLLADAVQEAGLPPGVVNIVVADRATSEYLVTHPGVDKVAFTGSTAAGRKIAAACGELLRPVTLELGGKSAAVVLDDADPATVADSLLPMASMMMSGQACIAQTRILAPRSRYDEVVEALVEKVRTLPVGDPFDPTTIFGPLAASRQRDRVESYISLGQEEGAKVAVGGGRPAHLSKGWYVEPTVLTNVDNQMRVAREEIFGPVAVVIPYDDTEDAVRLANDSEYGLGGGVYSRDTGRALDVARRIRTGTVTINGIGLGDLRPLRRDQAVGPGPRARTGGTGGLLPAQDDHAGAPRRGGTLTELAPLAPHALADIESWDAEADVVVAGYGCAGASAAIGALEAGGEVLILERAGAGGGSSAMAGGEIYLGGGTPVQKACGFDDTPEAMRAYLMAATGPGPDEAKIDIYCERSVEHFHWLVECGVPFKETFYATPCWEPPTDDGLVYTGGENAWPFNQIAPPAPRGHIPQIQNKRLMEKSGGWMLMHHLTNTATTGGAQLMADTRVTRLVVDEDGRVVGIRGRHFGADVAIRLGGAWFWPPAGSWATPRWWLTTPR